MAHRVVVSVALLVVLCVQQIQSSHKDIARLRAEETLKTYPLPRPNDRVRRQDKTYNFRQPIYDNHKYYRQQQLRGAVAEHWIDIEHDKKHIKLSNSGGGYDEVNATFQFRFYGHTIKRVYLSTAGVLSMSAFEDDQPPTHYIAQFLGHFSPNLHLDSSIFYESQPDKFIVEWRDVYLREPSSLGPFTLQTIVYPDGKIKFLYKKLPQLPANTTIDSNLIIGLVGSVNIDIAGIKLSAYYQAEFISPQDLSEGDVIIFHPKDTCDMADNCDDCGTREIDFDCQWCSITRRCYDALDRYTNEFKNAGCGSRVVSTCDYEDMLDDFGDLDDDSDIKKLIFKKHPVDKTDDESEKEKLFFEKYLVEKTDKQTEDQTSVEKTDKQTEDQTSNTSQPSSGGGDIALVVVIVVVLVVIGVLGGWSFYAYKNPDSSSGRWLIEHRPSQWKTLIFGKMAPTAPREEQEQPQY